MADIFDPNTPNDKSGLYWTDTGKVGTLPYKPGFLCTGIKLGTAGDVAWKNDFNGKTGIITGEAGEWLPIVYTEVLAAGTTSTGMCWTVCAASLIK